MEGYNLMLLGNYFPEISWHCVTLRDKNMEEEDDDLDGSPLLRKPRSFSTSKLNQAVVIQNIYKAA